MNRNCVERGWGARELRRLGDLRRGFQDLQDWIEITAVYKRQLMLLSGCTEYELSIISIILVVAGLEVECLLRPSVSKLEHEPSEAPEALSLCVSPCQARNPRHLLSL